MGSKKLLISGILLIALVALISSTQTWLTIELSEGVAAQGGLSVTGQQLSPPLAPMALALAALAGALTIAGRIFRFVLGALAALLGAGIVALTSGVLGSPLSAAAGKVTELTGIGGDDAIGTAVVAASHVAIWAPVTAAAGLIAALLGVAVLIFGSRWRAGGRKYETASPSGVAEARSEGSNAAAAAAAPERDRISDWDALSDGGDPSDEDELSEDADPRDAPEHSGEARPS